jgi:sterol desaturase/sphingolipid hydroxylase (fatty acid hydroxylase superfamily)
VNGLHSEALIRLGSFAGVFALMAIAEALVPRREPTLRKPMRWFHNLALAFLNTIALRIVLPLGAVGMAVLAQENGWGVFNGLPWPPWLLVVLAVVALDFVIYLQHVLFHAVPALWRLHMVHHADLDFDVTTGLRFHTLEILLSMGIKLTAVAFLGAAPVAVLIFEVFLNATSMFNHGNILLPRWLDRVLRLVLVTPDMHRVHHSTLPRETNSNFGFNLPWWDYLLGSYHAQPAEGHEGMSIGLKHVRDEKMADRLPGMLALPFVGSTGNYPLDSSGSNPARLLQPTSPGPSSQPT